MTNDELKIKFADLLPTVSFEEGGEWLNLFVSPEEFKSFVSQLRSTPGLDFDYLFFLTNVDWKTHFTMVYHFTSTIHRHNIVVKVKLTETTLK